MLAQIRAMKARGLEFLTIPDTYYEELREQLKHAKVKVEEDLDVLQVRHAPLPPPLPRPAAAISPENFTMSASDWGDHKP